MEIKLTERDIDVLQTMAWVGVLSNEQVKKFYGNPNRYHIRRLERFRELGYINRENGSSKITKKGMEAIGIEGEPKRLRRVDVKKRIKIFDLIGMFPGWDMKMGYEVKAEKNINRNSYLDAAIKRQGQEYVVYLIDVKEPRPVTLGRLWHEVQELPLKGLSCAIMLFQYPKVMGLVAQKVQKPRMEEILLLPYPTGIELFNIYRSDEFIRLIHKKLPGMKLLDSDRLFADYQWQGNYVSIMVANDAVKRFYLNEYYDGSYQREKKDVVIVCASDQRAFFTNLYPDAQILALNKSELVNLPRL